MSEYTILVDLIKQIRTRMPRIGGRKLYYLLQAHFSQNGIKIGRDAFFDLMRDNGLLIKPRRRYCKTTHSDHWLRKHDNLLADLAPSGCEQVLVSDITYVTTQEGFAYLFLVTDAYSRRILGYTTADNMLAESGLSALEQATAHLQNTSGVIHHSDGGVQYCSALYTSYLTKCNMFISMTEPASPTQNAIAERINGILKTEWLYHFDVFSSIAEAKENIDEIIAIYNHERPHNSLRNLTPNEAHRLNMENKFQLPRAKKKRDATVGGDLKGISCSECCKQIKDGQTLKEWPSCDIRHSPQAIPKTDKSLQVRPLLHKRKPKVLTINKKKQIHLQTN